MLRAVLAVGVLALVGCGQSRVDRVVSAIDWGPVNCRGLVHVYRPVTGLGYQWQSQTLDQAQIECGMDGPTVTWSRFPSPRDALRVARTDDVGAPYCVAGSEIVVDLFDFRGLANDRAFGRTCERLRGRVFGA
jgi:hypothetical protein